MTSVGNPRIAPTAHFTGQAWVAAGFPSAELFDTFEGRLLYGGATRLLSVLSLRNPILAHHVDYLHIRHAAYETRLRELAPNVIVEIGAGLSPRGLVFARRDPRLSYIEADLPGMVRAKERALTGVMRPSNYHLGTVDLLGRPLLEQLPVEIPKGARVVVVTEGVTDYLDMDEKRRAFENVVGLLRACGGGRHLFEVHARELFGDRQRTARAFTRMLAMLVGGSFEGRLFTTVAEAERTIRGFGFDAVDVLDLEALNDTPKRPPMEQCRYRILEGRVGA
jgi:O-methyltransferase involved in polyketide biosynthesis